MCDSKLVCVASVVGLGLDAVTTIVAATAFTRRTGFTWWPAVVSTVVCILLAAFDGVVDLALVLAAEDSALCLKAYRGFETVLFVIRCLIAIAYGCTCCARNWNNAPVQSVIGARLNFLNFVAVVIAFYFAQHDDHSTGARFNLLSSSLTFVKEVVLAYDEAPNAEMPNADADERVQMILPFV